MGWLRLIREMLVESLYPSSANCMGCGSPAGADEGWLCADCARLLKPLSALPGPRCPRCGRPLGDSARTGRCDTCGDWPDGVISAARFPFAYRRPVSGMIRRMKYQGVTRMADGIGPAHRRQLVLTATDVGRDETATWRVISDRTQAPAGAGYAMATRRIVSRVLAGLHRTSDLARLRGFFHAMTGALLDAAAPDYSRPPRLR